MGATMSLRSIRINHCHIAFICNCLVSLVCHCHAHLSFMCSISWLTLICHHCHSVDIHLPRACSDQQLRKLKAPVTYNVTPFQQNLVFVSHTKESWSLCCRASLLVHVDSYRSTVFGSKSGAATSLTPQRQETTILSKSNTCAMEGLVGIPLYHTSVLSPRLIALKFKTAPAGRLPRRPSTCGHSKLSFSYHAFNASIWKPCKCRSCTELKRR